MATPQGDGDITPKATAPSGASSAQNIGSYTGPLRQTITYPTFQRYEPRERIEELLEAESDDSRVDQEGDIEISKTEVPPPSLRSIFSSTGVRSTSGFLKSSGKTQRLLVASSSRIGKVGPSSRLPLWSVSKAPAAAQTI